MTPHCELNCFAALATEKYHYLGVLIDDSLATLRMHLNQAALWLQRQQQVLKCIYGDVVATQLSELMMKL